MRNFLLTSFLLLISLCFSQTRILKTHYRIINETGDFSLDYEKALAHTPLDHLRYMDARRQIPIEGTHLIVELFSANELLENYGKPVSPQTSVRNMNHADLKWKLSADKYRLELITKDPIECIGINNRILNSEPSIRNFGGFLYDSGGPGGNYSANETEIKTIYSDNGESPYLNFTYFSVENHFDILYIYDGPSTSSKLIGAYTGGTKPKLVKASGAYLTLVFKSDGSVNHGGWVAQIGRGTAPVPASTSADSCKQASPFCTGTNYSFPDTVDGTNTPGSGLPSESGPSYGCLSTQPNPAWYYLQIASPGTLVLYVAGSLLNDVDFICWGPFNSPTAPCTASLTGGCSSFTQSTVTTNNACSGNIVDCSYSTSPTETCTIANAVVGQYYMLLITNYEDAPQNIDLSQIGGNGATNCNIINCGVTASNTGAYCVGQTISLSAATTNTLATTYAWSGPNGFSSTNQNVTIPNATQTMAGTYSVTGTTGGTVTCVATTIVAVNTGAPPTVNSPSICMGSSGTLTASGAGSYTWNTGATTASITDSPTSTTVYTVTGSSGTCTASATATITVVSNPSITVSAASVCPGNSAVVTASGVTSYTWTPLTGLSSGNTATVSASPASTTVYTVNGSVGTCTALPVTTTVTVYPVPTIIASGTATCTGASAALSANGAISYSWSPANSLPGGSVGAMVTASPSVTTQYTVVGADANGCTNLALAIYTVYPVPPVNVTASPACDNETLTITVTPGYVNYNWPTIPLNTANNQIQIPNATTALNGMYSVVVTDANSCTNTGSVFINVYPLPEVTALGTTVCLNATGTLTANGAQSYSWLPNADLNTNTGNAVLVTPSGLTNTIYTVSGQDVHGCTGSATVVVVVHPLPTASITPIISKACPLACFTFTAETNAQSAAYNWSFGNGQHATNAISVSCFTISGTYSIKLNITDSSGCQNQATATVLMYPVPDVDFEYLPNPVSILEPKVQFINETGGASISSYSWNFGEGSSGDTSHVKNPQYNYANVGTYPVMLVAQSVDGCLDTLIKYVVIEQDFALFVPNAFTPNGDGKNEVFKAEGEGILDFSMYIFDRWGNHVFTSSDINTGWDGSMNNKGNGLLQHDVYVWKIVLKNVVHQSKTYTGTVTLVR